VRDLRLLPPSPRLGPLLPLAEPPQLRLLPALARLLHPLLAQLALRRLDVPELDLPGHEPLEFFPKLLDPLDLLARVLRPAHLRGPEAEPDHLLQDDLLLGAFLDPLVKLLACGHESRGLRWAMGRDGEGKG